MYLRRDTFTEGQMKLLRLILDKNQVKELRSIFDNDKQGYKYTLWLHRHFYGGPTHGEDPRGKKPPQGG